MRVERTSRTGMELPDESGEELKDGYGDMDGGRDLGEVEKDLGQQLVHAVRHLQDTGRQRHNAHLR